MSSWANRHLPRKRDISQIPSEFRPQIVPRVNQPQVIQSETFQKVANEVIYPVVGEQKGKKPEPIDKRQYVLKKVEAHPSRLAVELTHKNQSYVFVILRHIRHTRDNDLWISSYNSIRKYYTNKIVIIDDNSQVNTVNGKLVNTDILTSEWNGAGEILPYYYFLQYKWADKMIFIHDSMFLNRPFRDSELEDSVRFHWHFHPTKEDKKLETYLSLLHHSKELVSYASTSKWMGCFGATSIIGLEVITYLEEQYALFSQLTVAIRTRADRELFERILGIILFYEGIIDEMNCSNVGDILSYPGAFESEHVSMESAANVLSQRNYDSPIGKIWRGR